MMLVLLFPMPGQSIILQNNLDQMNFICISSCVLLNDQDFLLTSMIFQLGQVKNKDKLLKVDGKSLWEDQPESNNWETEMLFPIRKKL